MVRISAAIMQLLVILPWARDHNMGERERGDEISVLATQKRN